MNRKANVAEVILWNELDPSGPQLAWSILPRGVDTRDHSSAKSRLMVIDFMGNKTYLEVETLKSEPEILDLPVDELDMCAYTDHIPSGRVTFTITGKIHPHN